MNGSDNIYMKSLKKLKAMILDDDISIMQFGSRAKGDFDSRSDISGYYWRKITILKN